MPVIITKERFRSLYEALLEHYKTLKATDKTDLKWRKIGNTIRRMKQVMARDKVYAVKYLNILEGAQPQFRNEKRALVVKCLELLQKVILHKKLNPEHIRAD